jgi:hypothetical protein
MATLNLPPGWLYFLRLLRAARVPYLLIGGCAVAFHGYPRAIGDLDVFVGSDDQTAGRLVAVLEVFGHGLAPQARALLQLPERVIRLGRPPLALERYAPDDRFIQFGTGPTPIEIMTTISGVTFAECYPDRVRALIDGVRVPVISRAHLCRNKALSIRDKDADDFAHLL